MRPVFVKALIAVLVLLPGGALASSIVAARTLPAGTVLEAGDVAVTVEGAGEADIEAVLGRQVRTAIYEGRVITPGNLTTPTLVTRNALVTVTYARDGLSISTEGRALGQGGAGDTIRVLNIASRATITALINPDGTLSVVTR